MFVSSLTPCPATPPPMPCLQPYYMSPEVIASRPYTYGSGEQAGRQAGGAIRAARVCPPLALHMPPPLCCVGRTHILLLQARAHTSGRHAHTSLSAFTGIWSPFHRHNGHPFTGIWSSLHKHGHPSTDESPLAACCSLTRPHLPFFGMQTSGLLAACCTRCRPDVLPLRRWACHSSW